MKRVDLELVSHVLCPFLQSAVIVLRRKDVEFRVRYVDLESPPEWFRKLSPLGKTPVLLVRGHEGGGTTTLYDAASIFEYVDEAIPPSLQARGELARARERMWIGVAADLLGDLEHAFGARDSESANLILRGFWERLEQVENQLPGSGFFRGEFSLVDAAFAPVFTRIFLVQSLRDNPRWESLLKTRAWAHNLMLLPEVKNSLPDDFKGRFREFLERGSFRREVA